MRIAVLLCLLALTTAFAQETPSPDPAGTATPAPAATPSTTPERSIPLRFALPPLEGTISLGIYDQSGKLVRVLDREDTVSDFTQGHDALETSWDGNDDKGNPLPPGRYHARGYLVGNEVKVEGIDSFFNDWVVDDKSPHVRSLGQLWMESGVLQVGAELADGRKCTLVCDQRTGAIKGELPPRAGAHCQSTPGLVNLVSPIDCAPGRDQTTWYVDSLGGSAPREVKQISADHQLLRRLPYAAGDPQPERIEAAADEEKIFLIEQNDHVQRLRALALVRTTSQGADESVSDWKTVFEKKITAHQNFGLENGKPVPNSSTPSTSAQTFAQALRPNPLEHDQPGKVDLSIGIDEESSFLQTSDGLPLRTISDTAKLIRTLILPPKDNTVDVFQDDGAAVEQFRISNLEQMIAFDCGGFELK